MRKEFRDLATVEEAHEVLDMLGGGTPEEEVELADANRRVTAEAVESPIDVPGFDRSEMDGYAVRAEDTFGAGKEDPVALDIVGVVHTGESAEASVSEKEAVQVSTGALIPRGADAVVRVEDTRKEDSVVYVEAAVTPGSNVMPRGYDVARGEKILPIGRRLTSREIGVLSAAGIETVRVRGRPRVAVVSTGDELVPPGNELNTEEAQIHDVNAYTVAAEVEDAGGRAIVYDHLADDYGEIEDALERASRESDLVVSSGSTSASERDILYQVVEERGDLLLHGIGVKPGKPTILGRFDGTPYVGLPGNPISALMIFKTFASRLIRRMGGLPEKPRSQTTTATVAARIPSREGRTRLAPVGLVESRDGLVVYEVDKGSGATTSLSEADGYVVIDADTEFVEAGDEVDVELLDESTGPDLLGAGEPSGVDAVLDGVGRCRYRWLNQTTDDAVRKIRDGIADIATVNLKREGIRSRVESSGGVLIHGFEREIGVVSRDERDERDESIGSVAIHANLTGDIENRFEDVDFFEFRTHESVVNAVVEGRHDAGVCERNVYNETEGSLGFSSLYWESIDFLVGEGRDSKPTVEAFLDALRTTDFDAEGYRGTEEQGEWYEK